MVDSHKNIVNIILLNPQRRSGEETHAAGRLTVWQAEWQRSGRHATGVMADSPALIPVVGNNSRF